MSFELTQEEGEFLVKLARNTVKQYLQDGKTTKPPKDTPAKTVHAMRRICNHKHPKRHRKGASRMHRLPIPHKPTRRSSNRLSHQRLHTGPTLRTPNPRRTRQCRLRSQRLNPA